MKLSVVVLQKNRFQKSWQSHHVTDLLAVFFPFCSGVNEVEVHYFKIFIDFYDCVNCTVLAHLQMTSYH